MRRITKGIPPDCLTDWIRANGSPPDSEPVVNMTYDGGFQNKAELKQALVAEQLQLCGYTGCRVDPANSHIEHMKPQSVCRQELEARGGVFGRDLCDDLDYHNMIAAVTVNGHKPFGASARGNKYDPGLFVSPVEIGCDSHFRYDLTGDVRAQDQRGDYMIGILNLRHDDLAGRRRGQLAAFFEIELLTTEYLEGLANAIDAPTDGRLPEFSFAIRSVVEDLLGGRQP